MPLHFGVKVLPGKKGLELTREKYALINNRSSLFSERTYNFEVQEGIFNDRRQVRINGKVVDTYKDEKGQFYSDEWCVEHQKQCLENFDLHMKLFESLNRDVFEDEVNSFLVKYPIFNEVTDLNDYESKPGYYVMVLGEYCQVYCGTTSDIKKRIRQHWSSSKQFDRLLFPQGAVKTSIMSIDSFRSMDTTRILALVTSNTFIEEDDYISHFSPEFCTNRTNGGRVAGGVLGMLQMVKSRELK